MKKTTKKTAKKETFTQEAAEKLYENILEMEDTMQKLGADMDKVRSGRLFYMTNHFDITEAEAKEFLDKMEKKETKAEEKKEEGEKTMTMKEVVEKATGIFIVTPDKAEFYSFYKATNVKPFGEPTIFSDNGFECIDRGLLFTLGGYDFGLDLITYSWSETMGGYEVKESYANDAKFGNQGEERYRVWHGEIHDGCLALVLGKPESKESEEMSNLVIFHIMKKLSPKQFISVRMNVPASHFYPHSDQKPYGVRKEATEEEKAEEKKEEKSFYVKHIGGLNIPELKYFHNIVITKKIIEMGGESYLHCEVDCLWGDSPTFQLKANFYPYEGDGKIHGYSYDTGAFIGGKRYYGTFHKGKPMLLEQGARGSKKVGLKECNDASKEIFKMFEDYIMEA